MKQLEETLMRTPGGDENSPGEAPKVDKPEDVRKEEDKTLGDKIHDALQDWANKDQADQEYDDRHP